MASSKVSIPKERETGRSSRKQPYVFMYKDFLNVSFLLEKVRGCSQKKCTSQGSSHGLVPVF